MPTSLLRPTRKSADTWTVCAIPFGGPLPGGRDTNGEHFSARTDVKADWFERRPVLFHHGLDPRVKAEVVGWEGPLKREDDGWWADVWLERQGAYFDRLAKWLDDGRLYGSSGSIDYLIRKASDGEILVWPHVEQTLTLTPANIYARVRASKAAADFTAAGLTSHIGILADLDNLARDLRLDSPGGAAAAKVGRVLSARNLAAALDALDAAVEALDAVITRALPDVAQGGEDEAPAKT